jgi:hypothetical protein
MEIKNNKINLFGTIIKIKIQDIVLSDNNTEVYGLYEYDSNTIRIARFKNGLKLKDSEIKITILHELMHAIFSTGQYHHSSDDEPLVEWTARCLYKLVEKKII